MKQKPEDDDYELSRFHPIVKTMLDVSGMHLHHETKSELIACSVGPHHQQT